MNRKIALVLSAFIPLAVAFGACGEDACDQANDQIAACAIPTSGSSTSSASSGMTTMEDCSGAFLCKSNCINEFTCDQINGNLPAYTTCLTNCQGL
jgi:hypothetical protein